MTNAEKYMKEIIAIIKDGRSICDFVQRKVLVPNGLKCVDTRCATECVLLHTIWLMEEYEEPEVDWSQVAVDTPILVTDYEKGIWYKRHFAKYENGMIFAWTDKGTSWTADTSTAWNYAKLAEEDGNDL